MKKYRVISMYTLSSHLNPKRMTCGDGLGGRTSFGKETSRCYVDAGGDDDEFGKKSATSTIQADAFLQSAMNVAEDQQMRLELQDLKIAVEADPLTHHAAKLKAFGICATSAPDLMNLLTARTS